MPVCAVNLNAVRVSRARHHTRSGPGNRARFSVLERLTAEAHDGFGSGHLLNCLAVAKFLRPT
jgi:hypothetical protein